MNFWCKIGALAGCLLASNVSMAYSIDDDRAGLYQYGIFLSDKAVQFNGVSVYRQIVPKSIGVFDAGEISVKHATYEYGGLNMYSQDPQYATVNGVPFLDYVSQSYDVSDDSPMYSINSEMILCWFSDSSVVFEIEREKAVRYMHDHTMNFENHCIDNRGISEYWRGVNRDIEIR